MPGTRKLGRPTDHRKAMLRGMVTFLLENGQIETTVTRAKEVRAVAEKMITIAKSDDLHSKRQVMAYVTKESVAKKLFDEIAPKYADRKGGYTRVVRIGPPPPRGFDSIVRLWDGCGPDMSGPYGASYAFAFFKSKATNLRPPPL